MDNRTILDAARLQPTTPRKKMNGTLGETTMWIRRIAVALPVEVPVWPTCDLFALERK